MAWNFDGTTGYLNVAQAPVSAAPLTMACWFRKMAAAADYHELMSIHNPSTGHALNITAGSGMGAQVTAYEPNSPETQFEEFATGGDLTSVLKGAEVILVLVSHEAFLGLTPLKVSSMTSARLVFDMINLWDSSEWLEAGFEVLGLT